LLWRDVFDIDDYEDALAKQAFELLLSRFNEGSRGCSDRFLLPQLNCKLQAVGLLLSDMYVLSVSRRHLAVANWSA
jgi:hypothetical protein